MSKKPKGPLSDEERRRFAEAEAIIALGRMSKMPPPQGVAKMMADLPKDYVEALEAGKQPRFGTTTCAAPRTRRAPPTAPTDIYRLYDADDLLLYVGVSLTVAQRLGSHRQTKAWWGDVVRITVEHAATRTEALELEADLIRDLKPLHNIAGQLR